MSKTLLRPPEGVHNFTFVGGCGRPHEVHGDIDCPPCVEHVRLMPPEERISRPDLRAPIIVAGDTPGEIDALRRAEEARRWAASWRLVEAEDEPETAPQPLVDTAELERLRARLAELEDASAAQTQVPPLPANAAIVPTDASPAFMAGVFAAQAGAPRQNPFDGRSTNGKDWARGYDSVERTDGRTAE